MRSRVELTSTRLHTPLARLALCADCEVCFEIGPDSCPACGSETWSPLSRFMGDGTQKAVVRAVHALVQETSAGTTPRRETRHLLIVSRNQPKLFAMLQRELRDNPAVTVIQDRRDRRSTPMKLISNQRWRNVDSQIDALGWAIVRTEAATARALR